MSKLSVANPLHLSVVVFLCWVGRCVSKLSKLSVANPWHLGVVRFRVGLEGV